ncbi:MAG: transcription elongation factor GreA [Chloroflexi bacterium]|nr:transcription elongation factor GreA [Chloroflexota bacterium]MDA1174024.1 transcription elongation factor GreA [Chloroflexota bacterium]
MAPNDTYLTTEGLRALEEELQDLRNVRRPEIVERIQDSKEAGELENAEYEKVKSEQGFIEGRIKELESMIQNAIIIPDHSNAKQKSSVIELGSMVKVQRVGGKKPEAYTIVGSTEASPTEGKISNESPLGQALLGKSVDDEVEFAVPAGVQRFKILTVR